MRKRIESFSTEKGHITIILWALAAGWTWVCLALSWQTGAQTARLSLRIAQWIVQVLGKIGVEAELSALHASIRTMAHFGLFFVEGILLGFAAARRGLVRGGVLAGVLGTAVAVLAEWCKQWIPGRHLQWDETLLNVLGALCGTLMVCVGMWMVRRKRKI